MVDESLIENLVRLSKKFYNDFLPSIDKRYEILDSSLYKKIDRKELDENVIQKFINRIEEVDYNKYFGGMAISALINLSPLKKIHIKTRKRWNCLGIYNMGKRLMIKGDVNHYLGYKMLEGEIIVWGDADELVGYKMEGGRIIIMGEAGEGIGEGMEDGEIYVYKLDPKRISLRAKKGEIYKGIPEEYGGEPKLIWKKGKFKLH